MMMKLIAPSLGSRWSQRQQHCAPAAMVQPPRWQSGEVEALEGHQLCRAHQLGQPAVGRANTQWSRQQRGRWRMMARTRPSAIAVAAPVNGRSAAIEVLLMSFSSDIFSSCIGREGNGGGAAFSDHIPSSVRALACLCTPCTIGGHG